MLVDITQDGAGYVKYTNLMVSGFLTGHVETCSVYVFFGVNGYAMIHDTGQLKHSEIIELANNCGDISSVFYGINIGIITKPSSIAHKKRRERIKNILKPKNGFKRIDLPTGMMACLKDKRVLSDEKEILSLNIGMSSDPDKNIRKEINTLNNLFHPTNAQSLPIDIQYKDGSEFTDIPQLLYPIKYMKEIAKVKSQEGDNDFEFALNRAEMLGLLK